MTVLRILLRRLRLALWPVAPAVLAGLYIAGIAAFDILRATPLLAYLLPAELVPAPVAAPPAAALPPALPMPMPEAPAPDMPPGPEEPHVVFHRESYRDFQVLTGYGRRRAGEAPTLQYCYAIAWPPGAGSAVVLPLAGRIGDGPVVRLPVGAAEARPFGIPAAELAGLADSHCRFLDGRADDGDAAPAASTGRDRHA